MPVMTTHPLPDWQSLAALGDDELPLLDTALLIARDEYPDLDAHKNEHHEFIESIVDLSIGVAKDPRIHDKALDVLTEWLVTHLLQTDLRIRDHIECRQSC